MPNEPKFEKTEEVPQMQSHDVWRSGRLPKMRRQADAKGSALGLGADPDPPGADALQPIKACCCQIDQFQSSAFLGTAELFADLNKN